MRPLRLIPWGRENGVDRFSHIAVSVRSIQVFETIFQIRCSSGGSIFRLAVAGTGYRRAGDWRTRYRRAGNQQSGDGEFPN